MIYKFYSPILAVIDYTGDDRLMYRSYSESDVCDYKDYEDFDYLTQEDLVDYVDVINEMLHKEWLSYGKERGLMEYFIDDDSCNNKSAKQKVYSAWPKIEVADGKAYAVMVCEINEKLHRGEMEILKNYFTLQYSTILGDSIEQHSIETENGTLHASVWPEDFYIETEEEFQADMKQEQKQPDIGMYL